MNRSIRIFIGIFLLSVSVFCQKSQITKKNSKRFNTPKKAKEMNENSAGDESTYKNYQNKPAKETAKENAVKIDITKAAKLRKSAQMKTDGAGDLPPKPKEKDVTANSPPKTQFVDDNKVLERNRAKELKDNSVGDVEVKTFKKEKPNLSKGIKTMELIDNSVEIRKRNGVEAGSSAGDLEGAYEKMINTQKTKGKQAGSDQGKISSSVYLNNIERRKNAGKEAGTNSGDLEGAYEKMINTQKTKGKQAGSDQGKINANVLDRIKNQMKNADKEMGSNQGDLSGAYQNMINTQKNKGHQQATFEGNIIVRADIRKIKAKEMKENAQGDIVGGYMAMRNREKTKSKQIAAYTGTIDLAKITQKMKENGHKQATHTGNISVSLKERQAGIRARTQKATGYAGDIAITQRRKGSHPSALYRGSMGKDSYAAKEKARKKAIQKVRRNRDMEDPAYMKKKQPRPKYETEEYKIWETNTR
jgi:hypothetical protein